MACDGRGCATRTDPCLVAMSFGYFTGPPLELIHVHAAVLLLLKAYWLFSQIQQYVEKALPSSGKNRVPDISGCGDNSNAAHPHDIIVFLLPIEKCCNIIIARSH